MALFPSGFEQGLRVRVAGKQQHPASGIRPVDDLRQSDAVHAGHDNVGDRDCGRVGGEKRQRLFPVVHGAGGIARPLEDEGQGIGEQRLVIHDQNSGALYYPSC